MSTAVAPRWHTLLQAPDRSTVLRRSAVGARIMVGAAATLLVFTSQNYWVSGVVALAGLLLSLNEGKYRIFLGLLSSMAILAISLYSIYAILAPGTDKSQTQPIVELLGLPIYAEGIARANYFFMRIAPIMLFMFPVFVSIESADLGATLSRLRVPHRAVFAVVNTFEAIQMLQRDLKRVSDAQRARGLVTEGNVSERLKALTSLLMGVISGSVMRVQQQAIALDLRGFNSTAQKGIYRPPITSMLSVVWITCAGMAIVFSIVNLLAEAFAGTRIIPKDF